MTGLSSEQLRWGCRMQFQKTKECCFFASGQCRKGMECPYAHGAGELQSVPDLKKTSICQQWKRGQCPCTRSSCMFAHGQNDIRMTPVIAHLSSETSGPKLHNTAIARRNVTPTGAKPVEPASGPVQRSRAGLAPMAPGGSRAAQTSSASKLPQGDDLGDSLARRAGSVPEPDVLVGQPEGRTRHSYAHSEDGAAEGQSVRRASQALEIGTVPTVDPASSQPPQDIQSTEPAKVEVESWRLLSSFTDLGLSHAQFERVRPPCLADPTFGRTLEVLPFDIIHRHMQERQHSHPETLGQVEDPTEAFWSSQKRLPLLSSIYVNADPGQPSRIEIRCAI